MHKCFDSARLGSVGGSLSSWCSLYELSSRQVARYDAFCRNLGFVARHELVIKTSS